MEVRVRKLNDNKNTFLTEITVSELDMLLNTFRKLEGMLFGQDLLALYSYQMVCEDGEAYAELIFGEE